MELAPGGDPHLLHQVAGIEPAAVSVAAIARDFRVLVALPGWTDDLTIEKRILHDIATVCPLITPAGAGNSAISLDLAAADVLIVWPSTASVLHAPGWRDHARRRLRTVILPTVGYLRGDISAAADAGCHIVTVADKNTSSDNAEHALMLMLATARHLKISADAEQANWTSWSPPGLRFHGSKAAILGINGTSLQFAKIATGIGARCVIWDPTVPGLVGVERAPVLVDALRGCRFCLVNLGPEALAAISPSGEGHVVGRGELAMLPGAVVVLMGSVAAVDAAALRFAVEAGHLAGVGIDAVLPPHINEHWQALVGNPNVIATSRKGAATTDAITTSRMAAAREARKALVAIVNTGRSAS